MANAMSMPREYFPKFSEFLKWNGPGTARIYFIKGKHGFYNGAKPKKIEINLSDRKIYQFCSKVYQKMRNSNIWGGMFSNKNSFYQYFHGKIMILDFWDYNWALKSKKNLKSWFSHENIDKMNFS